MPRRRCRELLTCAPSGAVLCQAMCGERSPVESRVFAAVRGGQLQGPCREAGSDWITGIRGGMPHRGARRVSGCAIGALSGAALRRRTMRQAVGRTPGATRSRSRAEGIRWGRRGAAEPEGSAQRGVSREPARPRPIGEDPNGTGRRRDRRERDRRERRGRRGSRRQGTSQSSR